MINIKNYPTFWNKQQLQLYAIQLIVYFNLPDGTGKFKMFIAYDIWNDY